MSITKRFQQPATNEDATFPLSSPKILQCIRDVVKFSDAPTSLGRVPVEFGKASTGTLKADEWRIFATVFLPVALIILWGNPSVFSSINEATYFAQRLELTMDLVQAMRLAGRYTMTKNRAESFRSYYKKYLLTLCTLLPNATLRPNDHMAFHTYDFLLLFGPMHLWWTFPFERVNGKLQ
jgi:hypothetical protein